MIVRIIPLQQTICGSDVLDTFSSLLCHDFGLARALQVGCGDVSIVVMLTLSATTGPG
jgi:hypothetical protein